MTKRKFLGWLSAILPASLIKVTPAPAQRIVVLDIYARAGERVVCESGHHICTFAVLTYVGDLFDSANLTDWQQPEPALGTMEQPCTICGQEWFKGVSFHFKDGWR